MAGDWIKWSKGLADKREVVLAASRLQRDRYEIAGRIMKIWEWCDDNISESSIDPETGDASVVLGSDPLPFLSALCGLPGLAEMLASSEICWISVRSGGRLIFPNLGRHNGTTAKTRASDAKKKRLQRSKCLEKCPDVTGTKVGTREEKRREDIKTKNNKIPDGILSASLDSEAPDIGEEHQNQKKPPLSDRIPYQGIVDAYNTTMTELPKVRELTQKRRTLIRSAWQASPQRRSLEFFQAYLDECQEDPFLNGTGPYKPPDWRPSFDYLMKNEVVTKVFETAIDREERCQ
ncbi:hypothetical protein [Xylella fastidiosa]|uniref:hypothetical protein n=1 Tax=Xylella fastidiosa TaxID=2371 RepID=UPI000AD3F9C5|nr:hypothetical protein [Xylella fastidiosa]MDG5822431.1 hypothetical protein [Xylella fastidiosa subsp. pauca]MDG5825919.1 hypothetical protein [Xylella fastidiosa subsp. pauca]